MPCCEKLCICICFQTLLKTFRTHKLNVDTTPVVDFVLAFAHRAIRARTCIWKSVSSAGHKPLPSSMLWLLLSILPNRMWVQCCLPPSLSEAWNQHTHTDWTQGTDTVKVELEANEIRLTFVTLIVKEYPSHLHRLTNTHLESKLSVFIANFNT